MNKTTAAFLLAATCWPAFSFSQTDTIGNIPMSAYFGVYAHRVSGDTLIVFSGEENIDAYMTKISLTDFGMVVSPVIGRIQGLRQVSNGLFHLEYKPQSFYEGKHVMHFVPDNGLPFVSVTVNEYKQFDQDYFPAFPTAVGDRYYVDGYVGGQFTITESDGTSAGTSVIAQTTAPLRGMGSVGSSLWYVSESPADFTLYSYTAGQSPQVVQVFPKTSWNSWTGLTADANTLYFRLENTSGVASVWKSQLQANDAALLVDAFDAEAMQVAGNTFLLQSNLDFYHGDLGNPSALTAIQYPADMPQSSVRELMLLDDQYLFIITLEKGRELARITAGNTIALIDMVPGPGNGTYAFSKPENAVLYAATLSPVSNGRPVIQRYDQGVPEPLFRIGSGWPVKSLFAEGQYLYWAQGGIGPLTLLRRKLTDTETFPEAPSEEWLREAWLTYPANVYDSGYSRYNKGAFISSGGDVTIGFTLAENMASNMLFTSSYDDTLITPQGRDMFVRYDKYGNLLWMRSIGGMYSEQNDAGSFVQTADDDLVAVGNFTVEGVFGDDTLTAPPSPGNLSVTWAAKLDGENGDVLWKTQLHYGSFLKPEAMTTDPAGNTYLSFRYQGAFADIAGHPLQSTAVQMNALAKIDPNGNVLWAKNMPTPWPDMYCYTYVLRYDENAGTVLAVQSRGDFTTWPGTPITDWPVYVQTLDADGNVLESFDYTSDGLGLVTSGEVLENGDYFLAGSFRGALDGVEPFYPSTYPVGNSYTHEGYRLIVGREDGAPVSVAMSQGSPFYPYASVKSDGFVYLVGATGGNRLALQKYSQDGAYIGSKRFDEYTDLYNEDYRYNHLAVQDSHIVVLASRFFTRPEDNIYLTMEGRKAAAVLKFRNEGWVSDQQFEEVALPVNWAALETDFVVYPNNFEDDLYIRFRYEEHGFHSYRLCDLNGKLLASGDIGQEQIQELHFGNTGRGMLLLELIGNEVQTVKVVHAF